MKTPKGRFVKYEALGNPSNFRARFTCEERILVLHKRQDDKVEVELFNEESSGVVGTLGTFPSWQGAKDKAMKQFDEWIDEK